MALLNQTQEYYNLNDKTVTSTNIKSQIRIGSINVANSVVDEKNKDYKLSQRLNRLRKVIRKSEVDILGVNELRRFSDIEVDEITSDKTLVTRSRAYILSSLLNEKVPYEYIYHYHDGGNLSMGNAIMYNSDKFFLVEDYRRWLSDTPEIISRFPEGSPFGRSLIGGKFYPVLEGRVSYESKPLFVFCVHIDPNDKIKEKSVYSLIKIVDTIVSSDDQVVILGDMNFFEDGEGLGPICRNILKEHAYLDLGKKMSPTYNSSLEMYSTFYGFPHDSFSLNKDDLFNKDKTSRLDHILIKNMDIVNDNVSVWVEEEELDNRNLLYSDHFHITADVKTT